MMLASVIAALALPQANVGAEALPTYDERALSALDLLDSSPPTHQLRAVLENNRVSIQFAPMPPRVYARYSLGRHAIEIDSRWQDADTVTLAAVIAHEATHAQDAVSGYLSIGGGAACLDSEIRAFRTSALFWLDMFGPDGKAAPVDDLERQMNSIADRQLRDPAGLETVVRQTYSQQCGSQL
jgi:hypothetical protein